MNTEEKRLLIKQAAKLTALGREVERARSKLKMLVERGVSYDAREMLTALQAFQNADAEWKRLEAEHLELRRSLLS